MAPLNEGLSIAEAIERFLAALRIDRGASEKTIEAYRRDLEQWACFASEGGTVGASSPRLDSIEPHQLHGFFSGLHRRKLKSSSVARKTSCLRQFFKFCCMELGLEHNPSELLATPQLPRKIPKALSILETQRLLEQLSEGLPYRESPSAEALRARDRAMVYLLYASGLRVSELVGLALHQLDLKLGYVRVRGKGEKERIVPFAPVAGDHLRDWIQTHRAHLLSPHTLEGERRNPVGGGHLFVNSDGNPLSRQGAWKLLKSLAALAGIKSNVSPHVMRHSFATPLLQSGMNLRSLQTLLGHSDLSTTQIYAHVTPEHLKKTYRRTHPRSK